MRNRPSIASRALTGLFLFLAASSASASTGVASKLFASDAAPGDGFGSVAVGGGTLAVGAANDDDRGVSSGAVYTSRWTPGGWVESQKLVPADGQAGDAFGAAVSVFDDVMVVGASGDDDLGASSGSAYVYRWNGAAWVQEFKLLAPGGAANDRFGTSVAASGEYVAVGAYQHGGIGAAFVFRGVDGVWLHQGTLTSDASLFGFSIAMSGERIAVGGHEAVAIFEREPGGSWPQSAFLFDPGGTGAVFGNSVALRGDTLAVGAWIDAGGVGAAHMYRHVGGQWLYDTKLVPFDGAPDDYFGGRVALAGGRVVVGAHSDEDMGENTGAAYVYTRESGAWALEQKLVAFDAAAWDGFGGAVAIDRDAVYVGSGGDDNAYGADAGSVYVSCFPGTMTPTAQPPVHGAPPTVVVTGGGAPPSTTTPVAVPTVTEQVDLTAFDGLTNFTPAMTYMPDGSLGGGACCGGSASVDPERPVNRTGNESILVHSGQELRSELDLFVDGRDDIVDLRILRRHLTRRNEAGSPFGPAWSFGYRRTIRQTADGGLDLSGFGRADRLRAIAPHSWQGMGGRLESASFAPFASDLTLRTPGGTSLVFHTEREGGLLVGYLERIVSPNGNEITIHYESAATRPVLLERRIVGLTDSFGRLITFHYEDADWPDGVSRILDFDGRELAYDYDSEGRLLSARSPRVVGTGGLNDFPAGKTRRYSYLGHSDPRLSHALTSIVFPNQDAAGGEARLSWTYYTAGAFFGWVQSHTVGNPAAGGTLAAGGTYQYSYEQVASEGGVNDVVVRTVVVDRGGVTTTIESNPLGNPLLESIVEKGGSPTYTRTFTYTEDGVLASISRPLGGSTVMVHPGPGSSRAAASNEVERVRYPDSRGADQAVIRSRVVYEPIFQRPFKVTEERGFEPGNAPEDYTTTFELDYMEDLPAAIGHFAPLLGLTGAELQAQLAAAGVVDLPDVNQDGRSDQRAGNIVRIVHPNATVAPEGSRVGLPALQTAEELFRYNDFGQLVYSRDPEGNGRSFEYFGADDPDGDGITDVPGADPATGGYLRRVVADFESLPWRNTNHDPAPVAQETRYEYVAQGGFPGNRRGRPTAVVDPRGIRRTFLVNALDQVVVTERAADVSQSPEPGLVAFAYRDVTLYDANDNVIEEQRPDRDTLDGDGPPVRTVFTYDILDQTRSEARDAGGSDEAVTAFEYGPSQNLVALTRAPGEPEEARETWSYDARDNVIAHTRGAGSPEESTATSEIDANGMLFRRHDAVGADVDEIVYDGFDRPREVIDRVGNRTLSTYDAASNVVATRRYGPLDPGGQEILLSQVDTHFDERGRLVRRDRHLFHYPGQAIGTLDDGALDPGDGLVSSLWLYDRLGRAVGLVDADDDTIERRYDGLSRLVHVLDPLGNQVLLTWDANNNNTGLCELERSPLVASDEVFDCSIRYDALNRPTLLIDSNDQTTALEYDSRGNRTRSTDPLGNQVDRRYDRLDRMVELRSWLSEDGTNASQSNFDPAQGGGDGRITLTQAFDDLSRLVTRTDDSGNVTREDHDDLSRVIRRVFGDQTQETFFYNADDELEQHVNARGSITTWSRDAAGKPLEADVDHGGNGTVGTTLMQLDWDGLNRVRTTLDDNGGLGTVAYDFVYDSLSRKIRETQSIAGSPRLDLDSEWQGARRRVAQTYPSGRRIEREYDALDRQSRVEEGASGALIASFDYIGAWRDLRVAFGNGTSLDKRNEAGAQTIGGARPGYDGARRSIVHCWVDADGSMLASFVNAYNGPGGVGTNRRVSEVREHLARGERYRFDSRYRMIGFRRASVASGPAGGVQGRTPVPAGSHGRSSRVLDGTDKMTALRERGVDRGPEVDGEAGEEGMNQYSSFAGADLDYDVDGSLTGDGELAYRHDFRDRVVEVRRAADDALVARYLYAADGRRVRKLAPGAPDGDTLRFVYDGWSVIEERASSGALVRDFIEGRRLDEHLQMRDAAGDAYWYHTNSQGFVGALSDASGDVVEVYEYGWFGQPTRVRAAGPFASTVGNPYLFQGRRWDAETGLYCFRNRYYSPRTGEFLTLDPMGVWYHGQGNGYSALGADPWNRRDPLGLGDDDPESDGEDEDDDLSDRVVDFTRWANRIKGWATWVNTIRNKGRWSTVARAFKSALGKAARGGKGSGSDPIGILLAMSDSLDVVADNAPTLGVYKSWGERRQLQKIAMGDYELEEEPTYTDELGSFAGGICDALFLCQRQVEGVRIRNTIRVLLASDELDEEDRDAIFALLGHTDMATFFEVTEDELAELELDDE